MQLPAELNFSGRRRLPVLQSAEVAECGLVCMAMIARYHGHELDLNALRQRFALSTSGATLSSLMQLADRLGMSARPLRAEMANLGQVQLPAILHWNFTHFVVLKSLSKRRAIIHDPATGARSVSFDELSQQFTGVVLELAPAAEFRRVTASQPVRLTSLWGTMIGFWPAFFQILGLSIALQLLAFALPFQMQLVVDEGILQGDYDLLLVLALGFGGVAMVHAAVEGLRAWSLQVFSQLLTFQMVGNVVHHLMRLSSDWYEKRSIGDIMSRVSSVNSIQEVLTRGAVAALIDGLMTITAVVILFVYSSALALVVVLAVALNALLALALFPAMRTRNERQIIERAREQTLLMESVRAATTIKVMGREAEREGAWRNLYANTINAGVSVGKFQIALSTIQGFVSSIQIVLVIFLGARMVVSGDGFSIGMLIAFLSFRQTFTDRANSLINQVIQFSYIGLHLDRLSDIVTAERDHESEDLTPFVPFDGGVNIVDAGFRYGASDRPVFEGLNLTISPGEFVAITGVSGGGKTTLLKLLLGLREPTSGRIELSGRAATPELWRSWRAQLGLVAQDDRLLSGTIADNIAFFDPDMDMARVRSAASTACVDEEIARMPMQYMSLIGDMGSSLSGGQRQRVLLARALYRNPQTLVLDEGTANLDIETEQKIAAAIRKMPITRIVVAHRPALLQHADRVLCLEDGQLREVT